MSLDFYLVYDCDGNEVEVFDKNITHNLGKMAQEAGIYEALWRPEQHGYTRAKDIIEILKTGLEDLKARREHFEQFNSENGWGMYEHFVPFVETVLAACEKYPNATINTSR